MDIKLVAFKYGETELSEAMIIKGGDVNIFYDIALLYFLVQTNGHNVLIDVGCDTMPGFTVKNFIKPYDLLKKYGLFSNDITDVIITHSHHDHIQAVKYYNNAVIHIQSQEYENAKEYIPSDFKVRTFSNQTKVADCLDVIKIGGHSVGSSIVKFNYKSKIYVFVGDECYDRISFEKEISSGAVWSFENNINFIKEYRKPDYTTILFHENNILPGECGWQYIK